MSELLKSKHMMCLLIALIAIVGVLLYTSWTPSEDVSCGCATPNQYEGYVSPSLRSMTENTMKESLYRPKPKEGLINYARPPERFVPPMMAQMNSMRGSPVSKSMNSMANGESPFINYAQ